MKVVIMAGGKGTRITSVNSMIPKPMIKILGKPILEHQIEVLKNQKYTDLIIVIGYLGSVIQEYFGDGSILSKATGLSFGVNIEYIFEEEPLGTAGALYFLKDLIDHDFILLNGDIIFDIDLNRFVDFHKKKNCLATIFTHPNDHPFDSGLVYADEDGRVIKWLHKEDTRQWYKNRVNAGVHILSNRIFTDNRTKILFSSIMPLDLDRDILKILIELNELYCYDSPEYVKDMGTPERLQSVSIDLESGRVHGSNLMQKQKAVFLDRDGVINRHIGFLTNIDDFELIPNVPEAIKIINNLGYLAIVISNQPVIARGEVTFDELNEIHNKMETLLGQEGAYIDAIYICPHHPDKGFEGERVEFKVVCECRKPKPGMIYKAVREFNIEVKNSWMVGDNIIDIEAGANAKCRSVLITNDYSDQYETYESLYDFTKKLQS